MERNANVLLSLSHFFFILPTIKKKANEKTCELILKWLAFFTNYDGVQPSGMKNI